MSSSLDTVAPAVRGRRALPHYLVAATLARGADAGAAVGVILLATLPEVGSSRPALLGGLLATCLTAPHLLGPVLARRLDRAADGRGLLAAAFATYAVAVAAAALLLGRVPVGVPAALLIVAGACGPLLTGGLSSRLAALLDADERAQRRGQGWDAVTYGVGGSAGPAAVAVLAAVAGPRMCLVGLGAATLVAAALVGTLPTAGPRRQGPPGRAHAARGALRALLGRGPLRRVTGVTTVAAVTGGAMSVLAVALAADLGREAVSGALLAAAYGAGNLAAALLVTVFPLTGEPEQLTVRWAAIGAVAVALCAAVPGFPVAVAAFALAGAATAPFFTATLAARSAYAPDAVRAQVFVSTAALKVAAASLGTGLAGVLAPLGPRLLLVAGGVLTFTGVLGATVARRRRVG
ncbi:MFS transporter [Micromonospora sp. WMMD710]|uniref:MFS transporter n=1 Tax=Micromonospora sp. WMMD710 TaxID=3016085 RepID=UPI002417173C|nr:MFS transporter [Micromonospora sp. WMMD710]MDG4758994.1 MFS transporter [Micromonospora sp. WMMD710]